MKKLVLVSMVVALVWALSFEIKFNPLLAVLDLGLVWLSLIWKKDFVLDQIKWLVSDEK
jgi:hypothetical protein